MILLCDIAVEGKRSEADFHLCCFAIEKGITRDEVWWQVQQVGKFKEGRKRYFDVTWENAANDYCSKTVDKLEKRSAAVGRERRNSTIGSGRIGNGETPAAGRENGNSRPTIFVDSQFMQVADTLYKVTDCLLAAGNCFSRAEQIVVINNQQITPIITVPELAGLPQSACGVLFQDEGEGRRHNKPLPPQYASTWLNNPTARGRLPVIKLFTHNPVYTHDWRLVAPGFDPESGTYYAGPAIEARDGTNHLDALLQDFCFKTPGDRTNFTSECC